MQDLLLQKVKKLQGEPLKVQSLGDRVSAMLHPEVYELLKTAKPDRFTMHQWVRRVVLAGIEIELNKEGV